LAVTLAFFGFSLFQASWIAPTPTGVPILVAGKAAEPMRDAQGCATSMAMGYGGPALTPDINALASAVGNEADVVHVTTEMAGGQLAVAHQFESKCESDKARPLSPLSSAAATLTKPQLLWRAKGADQVAQLLAALPAPAAEDKQGLIGDDGAVAAFKKARPKAWAFSIKTARACASDYRTSGLWGSLPASCAQGTMLLTVDDLGYTLWGWPNRFLARTNAAGLRVVVAEAIEGDQIKGLEAVERYGDIANSFNGYIWIDNIGELGPALRR
jgi:glycerophosphoryl diester phosphodiesterase